MSAVFLCGFMGCGKSTVGKELAKLLDCDFIDLDLHIEKEEETTIPEIFTQHGESYFRELETKAIAELRGKTAVIATGGGALIAEENANLAKQNGVIIFINTDFEMCYQRIKDDKNRPLASKMTKADLLLLFNKRTPIYISHCDTIIDGGNTPLEIALEIQKSLLKI